MTEKIKYIGLDVHKNSITIAIADEGRDKEIRKYGTIENKAVSVDKFVRKLVSDGSIPRFVYEAGPCGYTLYHHFAQKGYECMVAAPSLIPKKVAAGSKMMRVMPLIWPVCTGRAS